MNSRELGGRLIIKYGVLGEFGPIWPRFNYYYFLFSVFERGNIINDTVGNNCDHIPIDVRVISRVTLSLYNMI